MLEADSSRPFLGVRFLLAGFDPAAETKVRSKLLEGGGVDAGGHDQGYTHVIVDKIAYDDPVCVKAREDGKTLVRGLWVDHSFEVDAPVDATSIIYRPLKDMNGIPGAKNLVMCLTGYQRQDRDDIMTMVGLMGAQFSKPLVANKVTHLICYKFEGEKYELANKLKRIKLVNHRWLEDCLSYWKLLPEENYSKSGYELEMMEAEAKDSDEEADDTKTKQSIPHAMESLQNSKDGTKASGSSEMGGQALGIGRLSASGVSRPLNSASVQLPNPQERTPESIRIADDPKSLLRSAEKASSQPDIKFSASINGKTPRRSPKSIFSRESSRADSSSADSSSKLHLGDPMHVPNIDNIEHVKDLFASGYDKAPQKEATELLTAETSIDKTQWMEASRPTTLLEKPQLTATPSASEFDSKSVVNNLLRSDKKPRLSGGFVRDILGKEKAEEINNNALLEIGGPGELQEHNKGESTTSPCSVKSGQKVPSTSASTDKDGKEAKTVQQPLRKKTIGKKTLGSKPKLNGTVNQKGSIYLNKTGGDDAPTISPDVECEGTGFGWVSGSGELDKSRETIAIAPEGVQNRAASGVARACFADDETEEPEDKEECATVLVEKNFKLSRSSGKMKQISREPQLGAESTSRGNAYEPEAGKDHRQPSGETVLNAEEIPQDIKGKAVGKKRGRPGNAGKTKNKTSSQKKSRDFKQVEKENHPLVDGDENQSPTRENLGKRAVASNETLEGISLKVKKSGESPTPVIDIPNQVKSQPAYFIMSGHRLQRKEFQQLIKRLRGKCCRDSHQWSYQATHYISPEPIRRTEKFFAAAASGRWILKTDYLTACNQAGKFIPEEPFEWHENGLSEDGAINLEAPRKWRLLRAQTGHGAFYGTRIVIYGECIAPPLDTLKRVLKAGDGTVLATSPPYTRFLTSGVDYAVISPGMPRVDMWVQEFLKHEIPCVAADYLVDYVCKPGCSLEKHVLYGSHASAKKSLANLLNRAEEVINY